MTAWWCSITITDSRSPPAGPAAQAIARRHRRRGQLRDVASQHALVRAEAGTALALISTVTSSRDGVQLGEVVLREGEPGASDVLAQMRERGGAGDEQDVR